MITSQLISFKDSLSSYNSFIGTTVSAIEGITEVFSNTQLLSIIAIITAIASVVFGVYKLAMHLGYFSPNENESNAPSAPPIEEDEDIVGVELIAPSAPPIEQVLSESSTEMQKHLFDRNYPHFGRSSLA